jgi:hypothetical protein
MLRISFAFQMQQMSVGGCMKQRQNELANFFVHMKPFKDGLF